MFDNWGSFVVDLHISQFQKARTIFIAFTMSKVVDISVSCGSTNTQEKDRYHWLLNAVVPSTCQL